MSVEGARTIFRARCRINAAFRARCHILAMLAASHYDRGYKEVALAAVEFTPEMRSALGTPHLCGSVANSASDKIQVGHCAAVRGADGAARRPYLAAVQSANLLEGGAGALSGFLVARFVDGGLQRLAPGVS